MKANIPAKFYKSPPKITSSFVDVVCVSKRLIIKGCVASLYRSNILTHPFIESFISSLKDELVSTYHKRYPSTPKRLVLKDLVQLSDFSIIRAYPKAPMQEIHLDYPRGRHFTIDATLFIGVTELTEHNGCTEIFTGANAELEKKSDEERSEIFNANFFAPVSSNCRMFFITSRTYHRGGANRSSISRDVLSLTFSLGVPCFKEVPCVVAGHHMNYEIEQRMMTRTTTFSSHSFSPSFTQFLKEKRASIGLKIHLSLHCLLGKLGSFSPRDILGYSCQLCGGAYMKWDNYVRHVKICKKFNIKECRFCPYTSIRSSNVRRHMINVHGSHGPHSLQQCSLCMYETPALFNLRRHIDTVHNSNREYRKKRYLSCIQCSYSTTRPYNLDRHVRSVHRPKKDSSVDLPNLLFESCPFCRYKTARLYNLKRHLKAVHQKLM